MKTSHFEEVSPIWQRKLAIVAMDELNVNLQHSIVALSATGWSRRRIARELGINLETVGRYLRRAQPKPAISTLGSEADSDAKPAIATAGAPPGRQSLCEPYSPFIETAVSAGLSAQGIYQDLPSAHGFPGSYQAVKRFVRHLRQAQPIPFVRMEVKLERRHNRFRTGRVAGGHGKRKRPHFFRIVLSHSRKGYREVVRCQTTEASFAAWRMEFANFGGIPKTLVIDKWRRRSRERIGLIPNSTRRWRNSVATTER